jgi:hypothetical protein
MNTMEERSKLVIFLSLFFIAILISFSLEKFVFVNNQDEFWEFIIPLPLFLTLSTSGFFVKDIKQLLVQAFWGTIVLMVFLFTTMYFEGKQDVNVFAEFIKNSKLKVRYVENLLIVFGVILSIMSFGKLLNNIYKLLFKAQKAK